MVLDYLAKVSDQFFWLRCVNKFQQKFRSGDPESLGDVILPDNGSGLGRQQWWPTTTADNGSSLRR
jgi:hypothetical protein